MRNRIIIKINRNGEIKQKTNKKEERRQHTRQSRRNTEKETQEKARKLVKDEAVKRKNKCKSEKNVFGLFSAQILLLEFFSPPAFLRVKAEPFEHCYFCCC